jgi:hypothetical protein
MILEILFHGGINMLTQVNTKPEPKSCEIDSAGIRYKELLWEYSYQSNLTAYIADFPPLLTVLHTGT